MKYTFWPIILNFVGIVIAMLYGVGGGSGGETTEGVFFVFWGSGWLTILLTTILLLRSIIRKELNAIETLTLVVTAVVGFLETLLWYPMG